MRVLAACSLGGAGHWRPLAEVTSAFAAHGDEVLVVGPAALAGMVSASGTPFVAGGEPAEADLATIREQLPVVAPDIASVLGNRELFGRLAARALMPTVERTIARWQPALVLRDPCEYASAAVAHATRLPVVQVAISLAEVEWGSIRIASPALEELLPGLTEAACATEYWTRFPASLDPSRFASTSRYTLPPARSTEGLPDWWPGAAERPLVYVTMGTVLGQMSHAAGVFRLCLDALVGIGARVLLTVGRNFDATQLPTLPDDVHVEAFVEQDRVLRAADVVVCHGGSGTVLGALAHGVPLVVMPSFADQRTNASLLVERGLAVRVDGGVAASPERLRAAVLAMLADGAHRERAHGVGAELASMPGLDALVRMHRARS